MRHDIFFLKKVALKHVPDAGILLLWWQRCLSILWTCRRFRRRWQIIQTNYNQDEKEHKNWIFSFSLFFRLSINFKLQSSSETRGAPALDAGFDGAIKSSRPKSSVDTRTLLPPPPPPPPPSQANQIWFEWNKHTNCPIKQNKNYLKSKQDSVVKKNFFFQNCFTKKTKIIIKQVIIHCQYKKIYLLEYWDPPLNLLIHSNPIFKNTYNI